MTSRWSRTPESEDGPPAGWLPSERRVRGKLRPRPWHVMSPKCLRPAPFGQWAAIEGQWVGVGCYSCFPGCLKWLDGVCCTPAVVWLVGRPRGPLAASYAYTSPKSNFLFCQGRPFNVGVEPQPTNASAYKNSWGGLAPPPDKPCRGGPAAIGSFSQQCSTAAASAVQSFASLVMREERVKLRN
jgi:hypothetical protein